MATRTTDQNLQDMADQLDALAALISGGRFLVDGEFTIAQLNVNLTLLDSGTATGGDTTTLADTGKSWPTNQFSTIPHVIRKTGGTGAGEMRLITSNTGTVITVPTWTAPDTTTTYAIFALPPTAAAIAAASPITVPVAKTLTVVTKAVTTAGTGVPLVASETFARKVYLNARKATGANTGMVYIGTSAVDMTTDQQMALAPGDAITIDPGPGCKVDLATIYIDCDTSNTDGVTGWYIPV